MWNFFKKLGLASSKKTPYRIRQRLESRRVVSVPLTLKYQGKLYTFTLKNISKTGVYIEGTPSLSVGSEVILSFELIADSQITTKAEVSWMKKWPNHYGMGLQFIFLSPQHEKWIVQYFNSTSSIQ